MLSSQSHDPQPAATSSSPRERSSTLRPPKKAHPRLHLAPFSSLSPSSDPNHPSKASSSLRPPSPSTKPSTHPNTATHPSGLRAQLAHLLPRHALFLVRLTIHQLSSVPLVHGEFGVRWKFKGTCTPGGLLGKVKGRASARKNNVKGKEKEKDRGRESDRDTDTASIVEQSISDTHSVTNSTSTHSVDHAPPSITVPSVVVSANSPISPPTATTRSVSTSSSGSHNHPQYLSAEWLPSQSQVPQADHPPDSPSPLSAYAPAKGHTPFVKLKDHNVSWEQSLEFVVQIAVGRESGELGDCDAKLVVMQRVIPGDPDAPQNPRLGAVSLNLAQYVDAGSVTRRYLLRQSKTNATLKLTLALTHLSGTSTYTAPPLPKGEILGGIAGLLEKDVYRTRPRILDLYASDSDSSVASTGSSSENGQGRDRSRSRSRSRERRKRDAGGMKGMGKRKQKRTKPFDVARLPFTHGTRGTERLIEALFNPAPAPAGSNWVVSPFLYRVDGSGGGVKGSADRGAWKGNREQHGEAEGAEHRRVSDEGPPGREPPNGEDAKTYAESFERAYADSFDLESGSEYQRGSDYQSMRGSGRAPSVRSQRSMLSVRSLIPPGNGGAALSAEEGGVAGAGESAVKIGEDGSVSTGAGRGGVGVERRPWWRRVLHPEAPTLPG
ncbi:hypothetical protein BV22DRAFT_1126652 [Leucogyrophana mollusca]|uniref:Uncharacterized protein n=1 Tax=Leucogyrophana mollusca TaxID=85980 RepID=A0ACB8BSC3_9AGAM|nr:hypothetical protein BV22DRAFT_1126652 [Leucogyrophana mollusca]